MSACAPGTEPCLSLHPQRVKRDGVAAGLVGCVPLQAPLCPGTNPKVDPGAYTPTHPPHRGPSLPNWLFLFPALCGESSPIIPTLSQPLGSRQQAWRVEAGACGREHPLTLLEGLGLRCLPTGQSAGVLGLLAH